MNCRRCGLDGGWFSDIVLEALLVACIPWVAGVLAGVVLLVGEECQAVPCCVCQMRQM
ncbi:hypothetical protein [Propionibacterium phage TCUCAP1]|nr:hypothetical protein [Propionibacterium phage TCUCAP1]